MPEQTSVLHEKTVVLTSDKGVWKIDNTKFTGSGAPVLTMRDLLQIRRVLTIHQRAELRNFNRRAIIARAEAKGLSSVSQQPKRSESAGSGSTDSKLS